jgi:predicted nucleotidyltransferase
MAEREARFQELLAYAREHDDVLGLYVFGSRASDDRLRDEHSDYDVGVVLEPGAQETFDARWPYVHGSPVEIATATLEELRAHAEYGTPSEWARPMYARVDLLVDKTGEVAALLEAKGRVPEDVRPGLVRRSLGAYVNATYRSLRYRMVGAGDGARLDAAESVPPLLSAIFALEGRVRPFNKHLESELAREPLRPPVWRAGRLLPRLSAVIDGDDEEQHGLFREVHQVADEAGFGDVIAEWEPDVAWLRGESAYREPSR